MAEPEDKDGAAAQTDPSGSAVEVNAVPVTPPRQRRKTVPMRRMPKRPDGQPPPKHTEDQIQQRRLEVFELHFMQGLEVTTIAEIVGVHRNTITTDLREIRRELAQEMRKADVVEEVAIAAAKYEKLAQMALYEMSQAKSEVGKSKLLGQAMRAWESKHNFLMNTGVLPSRRSQIDLRVHGAMAEAEVDGATAFTNLLEDPQRRRQAVGFVERLLGGADRRVGLPAQPPPPPQQPDLPVDGVDEHVDGDDRDDGDDDGAEEGPEVPLLPLQ